MVVEIKGTYQSNLRVSSIHGPSGSQIETDAPVDNQGKGERFSPTDLVVTSLASCMFTLMGIVAQRDKIDINGSSYRAEKHMASDGPRRIAKIVIEFNLPANLTADQKKKLENAARTCPVHHSLSYDIEQSILFKYA